ncbi:DUF4347 domain-containing protein [Anabaena sp. UHCC 0253]|uniref:DUF4347 domain-containing protein n=1 Tax=Anabaena sp. UHCC 0253 TaxID=2590019 RepID=UPI0014486226|nr:DUF4347 domain-containing protein [Anabaena sp. UHCC 0253]MTJ52835.1 DUF4347 domain-containing protein [Anabaena sp. UHCC 0253]
MANAQHNRQIAFIDSSLEAQQQLVSGLLEGIEVIRLKPNQDGIAQITSVLEQYQDKAITVHIVSHGAPGCVYLGNAQLNLDTFGQYAHQLQQWFAPVGSVLPNLFIYGCQVAVGDAGAEFLDKLRALTGANIAASANLTGNAALGGDWELEVTLGEGKFVPAFTSETMAAYPAVLDTTSILVPTFITDWLNYNNPNVTVTTTEDITEATYNGTVNISDAINQIASQLKLGSITQQIEATNPKVVVKGYPSNTSYYELSLSQLSAGQIMDGLGQLTGADLFKGLSSVGSVDLMLASNGINLTYLDNLTLDVNSLVGSGFMQDALNEILAGLFGDGNADPSDGTQLVLSQPQLDLINNNEGKQLSIAGSLNGTDFGINLDVQDLGFEFQMPTVNVENLTTALSKLAGELPGFATSFLELLSASTQLNFESNADEFKITYVDTLNIQTLLNTLSSELGLGENVFPSELSVTNPGLLIKKEDNGKRSYEFSIDEISPGEVVNFLASLAGTSLPDSIQSKLGEIGNASLTLSTQGIVLTYLDNLTLDVNSLVGSGFIQDALNEILAGVFGDGNADPSDGTQLVLSQPQLDLIRKDGKTELSIAGSLNGTDFGINLDGTDIGFDFEMPSVDVASLKKAISETAEELPAFVTGFLDSLQALNALKFESNKDEFKVTYLVSAQ